jgi:hypothetical protein
MPIDTTDVVNPGIAINAITPIVLTIDPARGEDGSPGAPGVSVTWRGNWQTGVTYNVNDAVARNGASYIAIVQNTSVYPATDNGSVWGLMSASGAQGPPGPSGVNYKGAWVSTTTYQINDLVTKAGNSYIAVASSVNIDPSTDNGTHWQVFAAAGSGGDMYKSVYDVNNNSLVDHAELADAAPWAGITGIPVSFPASQHAPTHLTGGTDPIPIATSSQTGLLRTVSGLTTDFVDGTNTCQALSPAVNTIVQPIISSFRLRSYNALAFGNCNFEIDQANIGGAITYPAKSSAWYRAVDRWFAWNGTSTSTGTAAFTTQQIPLNVVVPGTNYNITQSILRFTLTVPQASLTGTEYIQYWTAIEGPMLRELLSDTFSLTVLARSSVANLKFGISITDNASGTATVSLAKLCSLGAANTWTLLTYPNLPVFPTGKFGLTPGFNANTGAAISVSLASGPSNTIAANDTWQTTSLSSPIGISNFAGSSTGSTFDLAFCQLEPGSQSTQLQDLDFQTNLSRCQRYWQSSYDYGTKPGTVTSSNGSINLITATTWTGIAVPVRFPVRMASVPTMTFYSPTTGASGNIRNNSTSADVAVSGPITAGTSGYGGVNTTASVTDGQALLWHHVADTGY